MSDAKNPLRPGTDWPQYYSEPIGIDGGYIHERQIITENGEAYYFLVVTHSKLDKQVRVFSLKDATIIIDALDIVH